MQIQAKHNSQDKQYRFPFGAVECDEIVTFRLAVYGDIEKVMLRLWYEEKEHLFPMAESSQDLYEFQAQMPHNSMLVWYSFVIVAQDKTYYYCNNKEKLGGEGALCDYLADSYQITVYDKGFKTPDWFKDAVIYQIFVDRFHNGNSHNYVYKKRDIYQIHSNWNDPVPYDKELSNSELARSDFYGGNLKGIIKKLDYLHELGVTVLYLNPIFDAFSNHKYDTGDYRKIDAMFGDEEIFKELCSKAHKKGISIVLDGVFSHVGCDSKYFNKRGEYKSLGACQSKKSPYYRWFNFTNYPDTYDCWWGIPTLPNVNEMNEDYREYILNGEDSIVKHWLKCGARGWRLDVADELPSTFIKELRTAVKSVNKDAVVIGEVWEDASNKVSYGYMREYLLGKELDSVMNYPFKDGIIGFIMGNFDANYFNRIIMSIYENYPKECFYSLMNLIDGHDITRVKTLFGNAPDIPMEERAHYKLSPDMERLANKRTRLATLWQMTFVGVPCVYYGDEVGMQGYSDPFNRASFSWNSIDLEMLEWYKTIIKMRNKFAPLRNGDYIPLYAEGDVLCYLRRSKGGKAIIALNRSEYNTHTITLDLRNYKINYLINAFTGEAIGIEDGILEIDLPPLRGKLYTDKIIKL